MVAFVLTIVGAFSWYSEINKTSSSDENFPATTNAPIVSSDEPGVDSGASPSNWSQPLPGYAKVSASYVVGCCIGWFFRRLTRLVVVACGLAITLLVLVRVVGVDTTPAQDHVRRGSDWARHELAGLSEQLKNSLPSAAGTGVGMFMGFRRRRKVAAIEHPVEH